jgi:uncharacterized protein YeaO (DUF488 family)
MSACKENDKAVTIKNDKVYSSYYARACKIFPDWRLVGISRKIPDNFNGEILKELAPSSSLLYNYKNDSISDKEYCETYKLETLDMLNPVEVYEKLKGKVILCYCGSESFCHRHLVINWLRENLDDNIIGGEIEK